MSFKEYYLQEAEEKGAIVDGEFRKGVPTPSEKFNKPVIGTITAKNIIADGTTDYDVIEKVKGNTMDIWVTNQWYTYRPDKQVVQFVPDEFVEDFREVDAQTEDNDLEAKAAKIPASQKGSKNIPSWVSTKMKSLSDTDATKEWLLMAKNTMGQAPLGLILQNLADGAEATAKEFETEDEPDENIAKQYRAVANEIRGIIQKVKPEMEWEPEFGGTGE